MRARSAAMVVVATTLTRPEVSVVVVGEPPQALAISARDTATRAIDLISTSRL
jgi:hypothetical protein